MSVDEIAARATAGSRHVDDRWDVGRSGGRLIVAWQHPDSRLIAPVGLLEHRSDGECRFRYLRRATRVPDYRPFLSFPDWDRTYVSSSLFPFFAQRVMSPRRPDFPQYLRQLDLDEDTSPWEQLARSEGRSHGDTVQVFPVPTVGDDGRTFCRFLVHGIRYVTGGPLPPIAPGEPVILKPEPDNPKNGRAMLICTESGGPLGYVPDLLIDYVEAVQAFDGHMALTVEHVNGDDAPLHLRLLVRLDGFVSPDYRPMTGPGWETFSE